MKKSAQTPKVPSGRAAAYIRVSTADQGERYSLPSQLKALRDKAARSGKTIPDEWIFQDAHTGKLDSRPAFDRLKALVKTGAPDVVYIFDVSRFARKAMDALWLAAEFKRYGVGLDFVELPYQDTPTGRLTFTQMAAVVGTLDQTLTDHARCPSAAVSGCNARIVQAFGDRIFGHALDSAPAENVLKPESKSLATLKQERTKLQAKIKTTRRMIQDSAMPYSQGLGDIRAAESRVNAIAQELAAAGSVIELPTRRQVEAAVREILAGPEPTTYDGRSPILERIRELKMMYYDHTLEITGKIPIPAKSTTSSEKNWDRGVDGNPNTFACIPFILKKRVA